jgi:hemolysin III
MHIGSRPGKPKLRGVLDIFAILLAAPGAYFLIMNAKTAIAATSALVYGLSLTFLFAVSAIYHTAMWPLHLRAWLKRIDHSAIYVLIAGSYTPVCMLALGADAGTWVLWLVWIFSVLGFVKSFLWPHAPRFISTGVYLCMGWLIVPHVSTLYHSLSPHAFLLLALGGFFYTLGAFVYAKRWPNPNPRVFGYHEVFHSFVVVAGACHYAAIWNMIA